ncbi:ABC transporter substrate-binding protein [Paenibacillus sp. NPDC056933]|uniref:ABC transporter substrate-binding protein n=1 Tax=Paenibacillus sp. NPDC056933 TaxID=3345968 RepID=UPI003643017A
MMIMMRKWMILLGGLLLTAFLLAGCFDEGTPGAKSSSSVESLPVKIETPPVTTSTTERSIILGFSQLGSESAWREANTASIREAAEEAGITLITANAEQSQTKQFEAIRSFIDKKVDVIAIAPVVESGWEEVLQEVKQAGIPVVVMDRSVKIQDPSLFVTLIGSDFYEEGVKAAKYMMDKMRHTSGAIQIAELQGTVGSTPSIDRGRGFRDTIAGKNQFQIGLSQSADFTQTGGRKAMQAFLDLPPDQWPQLLYSHNDDMAIGAVEAIEEAGLKPGQDIIIISVDGTRRAFEQMIAGKINAVVECNPLLGPLLMQATKEIMAGKTLPKRMVPSEDIFPQELAAMELAHRRY